MISGVISTIYRIQKAKRKRLNELLLLLLLLLLNKK